jgi:4-amino-4-deoxy-L-arabinose transferase-like glycosyltransferase
MRRYSSELQWHLAIPVGLLLTNGAIILTDVSWLRLLGGVALVFVLPGLAWLHALNWFGTRCGIERIALLGGLSAAISSAALLGAVYWPGPWDLHPTLIALDLVTLLGVVVGLLRLRRREAGRWVWPAPTIFVALLAILCVAVFLRWYNIGYAEFHEDALENVRLAVRAVAGEEYAPFLDSKGPVHWLLPGALWLSMGWVNEGIARSPFAICGTLAVLAVYALGRRMAGPSVGVIGSAFVAVNGFFVAYSRHVENPTLVVLWGVLAAWCAYRFYQERMGSMQILGALFLGIGLIAHPDVLLYLPPFAFMLALTYWRDRGRWHKYWRSGLLGLLLFLIIALVFYVPFVLDPSFQRTQEYFASERIGTRLLYNRVANMLEQDRLYSTRYYAPLLILFSGVIVFRELFRLGRPGALLAVLVTVAAVTTVLLPSAWDQGALSLAFLPYAVLFAVLALSPHTPFEVKSLLLWFGVPFLGMQFLAKDAADHVQIAYPFWALLAAMGVEFVWRRLYGVPGRVLKVALVSVLACVLGLILHYQYLQFLGTLTGYWRAEADAKNNPTSVYRILYGSLPRPRKLFGNPRLGGWKVVGHLYDTGQLTGDFRSINESFAVPIWYTHQTPRSCFNDPQNYFVRIGPRGEPKEMAGLTDAGYGLTRIVRIHNQPKLYLFEKGVPSADEPLIYDVNDYRVHYDRSATPERYSQTSSPGDPLDVIFGGKLRLRGYDLRSADVAPGDTLDLTLYWQATASMDTRYRTFVHVETDRMWGQHDDDPICRARTDELRSSQAGAGQFRVTLDPTTPPGEYPVTVGVYDPETWERLEVVDEQGRQAGDAVELTTITVE